MPFKYLGNTTNPKNPLWNEYIEVDANGNAIGESTLKVHTPQRISDFDTCDHYYEYFKNGEDAVCNKCGLGTRIVLGLHKIVNGKLTQVIKP